MQWYYVEGESARGPVDAGEIENLAATGALQPQTLVWREGMANWEPFQAVAARGELRAPQPAAPNPASFPPVAQPQTVSQTAPADTGIPPGPDQISYCSACGRRLPLRAMHVHGAQVLCPTCFEST